MNNLAEECCIYGNLNQLINIQNNNGYIDEWSLLRCSAWGHLDCYKYLISQGYQSDRFTRDIMWNFSFTYYSTKQDDKNINDRIPLICLDDKDWWLNHLISFDCEIIPIKLIRWIKKCIINNEIEDTPLIKNINKWLNTIPKYIMEIVDK